VDFAELADKPETAAPTAALAGHIARTGTVRATAYTEVVDLLLGLDGVLYATEAAEEDEDPVIDPDGCAWIAGGLEKFVAGHERQRSAGSSQVGLRSSRGARAPRSLRLQGSRWRRFPGIAGRQAACARSELAA